MSGVFDRDTGTYIDRMTGKDGAADVVDRAVKPGMDDQFDAQNISDPGDSLVISATGAVATGIPARVKGFVVLAGTSPTLTLYDATSATGDPIYPAKVLAIGDVVTFPKAIQFNTGCWAVVGGTSPKFRLVFERSMPS